ncbi:unnamed protein product [Bursaphelenchus xylophilus]|uniref:Probable U2 small nuclear ribonucleoprotein A' n=1 Tax=Bursaphelenchus xylophilus TaxID=6326 RepID=A0A1I7RPP7_BURXY|nr:unnamed protein product [Bursaphelenchus xylophilus]CAG9096405.1 unnamed protein product [Bursaphelenchus xylophilus]
MVRLSAELIHDAFQYVNAVKQRELNLRDLQIPAIENFGATRNQYDVIDLTDNNIRKLENFPFLKRLESLLLHNNRIQYIQKDLHEKLPNLNTLALTNNNLAELGDIEPLAKCKKLEYLTLMGNPLTHKPHYRAYVIYKLRSVRVLDFKRIKLAERQAALQLFKGAEGKKLREQLVKKSQPLPNENEPVRAQPVESNRTDEEQEKIRQAIQNAKTLAEVEHLQSLLQHGKVPDPSQFGQENNGSNPSKPDGQEEEEDMDTEEDVQPLNELQNGQNGEVEVQ